MYQFIRQKGKDTDWISGFVLKKFIGPLNIAKFYKPGAKKLTNHVNGFYFAASFFLLLSFPWMLFNDLECKFKEPSNNSTHTTHSSIKLPYYDHLIYTISKRLAITLMRFTILFLFKNSIIAELTSKIIYEYPSIFNITLLSINLI